MTITVSANGELYEFIAGVKDSVSVYSGVMATVQWSIGAHLCRGNALNTFTYTLLHIVW